MKINIIVLVRNILIHLHLTRNFQTHQYVTYRKTTLLGPPDNMMVHFSFHLNRPCKNQQNRRSISHLIIIMITSVFLPKNIVSSDYLNSVTWLIEFFLFFRSFACITLGDLNRSYYGTWNPIWG